MYVYVCLCVCVESLWRELKARETATRDRADSRLARHGWSRGEDRGGALRIVKCSFRFIRSFTV